jgi:amino acid permease
MQHLIVDFNIIDFPMKKDATGQLVVDTYASKTMFWRSLIMIALMFMMMPLALLKNLSALRYFSMGNLCVLFYIIFTTLWQSPKFIEKFRGDPDYHVSYVV